MLSPEQRTKPGPDQDRDRLPAIGTYIMGSGVDIRITHHMSANSMLAKIETCNGNQSGKNYRPGNYFFLHPNEELTCWTPNDPELRSSHVLRPNGNGWSFALTERRETGLKF